MNSPSTSRATKLPKRLHAIIQVNGGGDARQAEYAVLTLDTNAIDTLHKRRALSSALQALDESFGQPFRLPRSVVSMAGVERATGVLVGGARTSPSSRFSRSMAKACSSITGSIPKCA